MDRQGFLTAAGLAEEVLDSWLDAGWLTPLRQGDQPHFAEVDLARARLIRDLRHDLGVNDEGVAIVLDLLAQVHGLRRVLRGVVRSLDTQPEEVRIRLVAEIEAVFTASGRKVDP